VNLFQNWNRAKGWVLQVRTPQGRVLWETRLAGEPVWQLDVIARARHEKNPRAVLRLRWDNEGPLAFISGLFGKGRQEK